MWHLFILIFILTSVESYVKVTFTGNNLNPVISEDGRYIFYEGSGGDYGHKCPQIYRIDLLDPEQGPFRISNGIGSSRGLSFINNKFFFSSNFHHFLPLLNNSVESTCQQNICERKKSDKTLQKLCRSKKFEEMDSKIDLFQANWLGNIEKQITRGPYFNGEVTVTADGGLLYSSTESGDPEIWKYNQEQKERERITNHIGYDGEAAISPEGKKIVFISANIKNTGRYQKLLHYSLMDKSKTELFSMDADGSNRKQITFLGGSVRHPKFIDETTVIFSSNHNSGRQIYTIGIDGKDLSQITFTDSNDYPMVSGNGKKVVWASKEDSEWNILVADTNWIRKNGIEKLNEEHEMSQLHYPGEKHLNSIRQLTFGGQNAEGYFDFQSKNILFQATGRERYGTSCDQIYKLNIEQSVDSSTPLQRISTGLGACTCSYFFPNDQTMIYASTFASVRPDHLENTCPVKRCQSKEATTDPLLKRLCNTSYTWDLFPEYDIYKVNRYGNIIKRLTNVPGYDAEGAVSKDGKNIVFTSLRTGDPELWLMDENGDNLRQLTNHLGYDGGPFFSPDGTKVIFRASRPKTKEEITKYKQLLSYNLVEPLAMELFEINVDGTGMKQITELGGSNWAPFFLVDNNRILYSTNFNQTGRFGAFDIYMVNQNGEGVERITYNEGGFDAFPMQSRNGKKVIWGSSRNGKSPYDLNLFLADWTD
uniref:Peptidase_S9 domain-containing protein n=1 Tax=Bursaphelenchus xylophilus TaxID=6326 RepID=A0A1I7RYA9_BURXY